MRWRLDDNERGAFNYLVGGVVIVMVLRGLFLAVDAVATPEGTPPVLEPFRQGYYLRDAHAVVCTGSGRLERLAFAAVWSLGVALAIAGLVAIVARMLGRSPGRMALRAARPVLVLALGWSVYAALFIPVSMAVVADHGLTVHTYRGWGGVLPFPFTRTEERIAGTDVDRVEALPVQGTTDCASTLVLQAVLRESRTLRLGEERGPCPLALERLRQASEAAVVLEERLR
jgi:hypothetical protein